MIQFNYSTTFHPDKRFLLQSNACKLRIVEQFKLLLLKNVDIFSIQMLPGAALLGLSMTRNQIKMSGLDDRLYLSSHTHLGIVGV